MIHNTTEELCRGNLSAELARSNLWIAPKKGNNTDIGKGNGGRRNHFCEIVEQKAVNQLK